VLEIGDGGLVEQHRSTEAGRRRGDAGDLGLVDEDIGKAWWL
jgi:hypothetical protein